MKKCKLCGLDKPKTEYGYRDKKLGKLFARCKDCMNEYYRDRHRMRRLRGWKPKPRNPEQQAIFNNRIKQFYIKHPERQAVKSAVQEAVKRGERFVTDTPTPNRITGDVLFKMPYCPMCGTPTPPKSLHGHHFRGYKYPKSVIFICQKCHATITAKERDAERKRLNKLNAVGNLIRKKREILFSHPLPVQEQTLPAYNALVENPKQETSYEI